MTAIRPMFLTLGIVVALGVGSANAQTSVTQTPGAQPTGQATPPAAGQPTETTMKNAATGSSGTVQHPRTRRTRLTSAQKASRAAAAAAQEKSPAGQAGAGGQ